MKLANVIRLGPQHNFWDVPLCEYIHNTRSADVYTFLCERYNNVNYKNDDTMA